MEYARLSYIHILYVYLYLYIYILLIYIYICIIYKWFHSGSKLMNKSGKSGLFFRFMPWFFQNQCKEHKERYVRISPPFTHSSCWCCKWCSISLQHLTMDDGCSRQQTNWRWVKMIDTAKRMLSILTKIVVHLRYQNFWNQKDNSRYPPWDWNIYLHLGIKC